MKNGWRHKNFIIGKKQSLTNSGPSAKIAGMRKVMRKRSTPQAPSERMIHRLKGHPGEQERKVAFELDCWSQSRKNASGREWRGGVHSEENLDLSASVSRRFRDFPLQKKEMRSNALQEKVVPRDIRPLHICAKGVFCALAMRLTGRSPRPKFRRRRNWGRARLNRVVPVPCDTTRRKSWAKN